MTERDRTALFFEALEAGQLEEAEKVLKESYDLLGSEDKSGLFWINNNHIYLNVKKCDFQKAREVGSKNINLAEELGQMELKHIALHQLAYIEREAKQYHQALEYISQEKEIISQLKLSGNDVTLAEAIASYEDAYLHFLIGDIAVAETEMRISLDLALLTDDEVAKACAYRGLGEVLADIQYLQEAKMIFSEIGDTVGELEVDELIKALK